MRLPLCALILMGSTSTSWSDNIDVIGEISTGYVAAGGELGGADVPMHTQIGFGLRMGRFAIEAVGDWRTLAPDKTELHSDTIIDWSLGPQLRWFAGDWAYLRGGLARHWLHGVGTVRRQCGLTGSCDAGFYEATPDYDGLALRAGGGIYRAVRAGDNSFFGISADLGVETMRFDFFGQTQVEHMAMLSIGVMLGSGKDLQQGQR
jgi:hypothetical protein